VCEIINLREFVGPPKGGTPKNKLWKVETHNAVLRTITSCLLDF